MARSLRWRDLRIGIAALVVLAAITYGILVYGRLGRLPGETYHAYIQSEDARGIIKGSEVWLNGQKVGAVREIEFLSPAAGGTHRVLLRAELVARHRDAIRHDSEVQIRSGGSLIGAPVVYIMVGTAAAPVVEDGDTIRVEQQVDLEAIGARYADVASQLPVILEDAKSVAATATSTEGTIGSLMTEGIGAGASGLGARAGAIVANLRNGRGTLGRAMSGDGALVARAKLAMARADSVRELLGSSRTSLGRFRRDSTLAATVGDIRNELSIVGALLAEPRGTAGRMVQDSAIVAGVADVQREMSALLADLKKRPFRYLSF